MPPRGVLQNVTGRSKTTVAADRRSNHLLFAIFDVGHSFRQKAQSAVPIEKLVVVEFSIVQRPQLVVARAFLGGVIGKPVDLKSHVHIQTVSMFKKSAQSMGCMSGPSIFFAPDLLEDHDARRVGADPQTDYAIVEGTGRLYQAPGRRKGQVFHSFSVERNRRRGPGASKPPPRPPRCSRGSGCDAIVQPSGFRRGPSPWICQAHRPLNFQQASALRPNVQRVPHPSGNSSAAAHPQEKQVSRLW